ncbi:MAG: porphobilinogen synthase, partial [Chloroflexota bacterium]|nr:porphobilinogen synthase [Chloroflexota bacterium]
MVRETHLAAADFIYPLFVTHGQNVRRPIVSMPGVFQLSVDQAVVEAQSAYALGIPAVLLFGIPAAKDPVGLENFADDGIVQQAIRALKAALPDLVVITDVCLCEYTSHGHCGVLNGGDHFHAHLEADYVLNDETLLILQQVALAHAAAGADIIAPSGMMDGMVQALRQALDAQDFAHVPIMA